jgi:hypothetical protein
LPTHISAVNPDGLAPDTATAAAVFRALLNDQPLPGAPTAAVAAPTATGSAAPADPAAATDRSGASQPTTPAVDSSAAAALSPVNAGQPTCA